MRASNRAASRSNPTPLKIASPRTAITVKRDGTRMKFMPGSQYTQGHSPTGDPTDNQTAASVSSA